LLADSSSGPPCLREWQRESHARQGGHACAETTLKRAARAGRVAAGHGAQGEPSTTMRLPATCADMADVMERCNKALGLRKGAPPAQRILTMEGTEVVSESEIMHGQSLYYSFAAAPAAAASPAPHTSKRRVSQVRVSVGRSLIIVPRVRCLPS
jgi:hypothetical protein